MRYLAFTYIHKTKRPEVLKKRLLEAEKSEKLVDWLTHFGEIL